MRRLAVQVATLADAAALAPNLRAADVAEVAAASGSTPLEALENGVRHSDLPRVILDAQGPIAIFGAVVFDDNGASPWLLGSDRIQEHRREFLERSRHYFARLRAPFLYLANYIDERNTLHVRWIKWLGFTIAGRVPDYGAERRPFLFFEWRRPSV